MELYMPHTACLSTSKIPTALLTAMAFLGALLSFSMEPLAGRMLVPFFGGAIHVWLTCVMFFQAVLLAAYCYSHFFARKLGRWHLLLLFFPFLSIPFKINPFSSSISPITDLLYQLIVRFSLPFFVLSTTAIVAQLWLTMSKIKNSEEPYALYAASNAGSFTGLFGYPLLLEPLIGVKIQTWVWTSGYVLYAALVACVWLTLHPKSGDSKSHSVPKISSQNDGLKLKQYVLWLVLSALPSAFFLSATNLIALEIGSFPLVWIIPLALYLASFIITFKNNGGVPNILRPFWLESVLVGILLYFFPPIHWVLVLGHLLVLFALCLLCHGELYQKRPPIRWLTNYYITIAAGGWLGGLFVSLFAPCYFTGLYEYFLAVVAMGSVLWWLNRRKFNKFWREAHIIVAGARLLPLAVIVVLIGFGIATHLRSPIQFQHRNFYGTYKIIDTPISEENKEILRKLSHGTTLHGSQLLEKKDNHIPTSYYFIGGNISNVFSTKNGPRKIAVIGLGSGTASALANADDHMTFYEIDPDNEKIARKWFTYLNDSVAKINVIVGDGRLALNENLSDAEAYDLIFIDAFTGDGIPTHLLTREAINIYLNKLTKTGVILLHISNRYYDLAPIIQSTASSLNLKCVKSPENRETEFKWANPSICIVASREEEALRSLIDLGWNLYQNDAHENPPTAWTDDYVNIIQPIIMEIEKSL
jgi:predicted O-methyltransferase YrrM